MQSRSVSFFSPKRLKSRLLDHKDALLCIVDQGVVSVAGFATSVLIGRSNPEELGVYFIAWSIVYFIRGFQEQMISVPYTIFHHKHKDGLAGYRGSCMIQQFGLTTLAFLFISAMTVAASFGWLESSMLAPLVVLLLLMPSLLMREVVRQYCFTHQKNISVLAIDTAITVLQIGGLVGLGYCGLMTGANAWAVIGGACLLTLLIWYFQSRPEISFEKTRLRADWNQNWGFGKWAVGGQLVGSLPTYIVPWMLVAAAGTAGTGFFAAANTISGVANIFNTGMANFLTPKAAQVYVEEGAHGLRRVVFRASLVFLVAVGGFCVLMAVFGGQIAVGLYGNKYIGLQTAITIMAAVMLFESFAIVASNGLFVMEKIKANFWVDVILMIVSIAAAISLIYPFGVLGAVWASLVGAATSASLRFVLLIVYLNREIRHPAVLDRESGGA